jgi:hypothetical protein
MDLHMLTTTDNPFSPQTQYTEWLTYDLDRGYRTNELLDRVVYSSPELSPFHQALAIEDGINEIVTELLPGIYTKVKIGSLDLPDAERGNDSSSAEDSAA